MGREDDPSHGHADASDRDHGNGRAPQDLEKPITTPDGSENEHTRPEFSKSRDSKADGQGLERSGYTPYEEGESLWKSLAALFGLKNGFTRSDPEAPEPAPWEEFYQKIKKKRLRRSHKSSDWESVLSKPDQALNDRSQINDIRMNFVAKILPVLAFREAYQHPSRAIEILGALSNVIREALKANESKRIIADELNLLLRNIGLLVNDLVFLAPTASDLASLATTVGGLSSQIAPARLNDLRTIGLILRAIETRSELTGEEKNLLNGLNEIEEQLAVQAPPDLTNDPAGVGRILWDLLPGPLSRILVQKRYFESQNLDETVFAKMGEDFLKTSNLDFFGMMIKMMPRVKAHLKERERAKMSVFPIERRGAEDSDGIRLSRGR